MPRFLHAASQPPPPPLRPQVLAPSSLRRCVTSCSPRALTSSSVSSLRMPRFLHAASAPPPLLRPQSPRAILVTPLRPLCELLLALTSSSHRFPCPGFCALHSASPRLAAPRRTAFQRVLRPHTLSTSPQPAVAAAVRPTLGLDSPIRPPPPPPPLPPSRRLLRSCRRLMSLCFSLRSLGPGQVNAADLVSRRHRLLGGRVSSCFPIPPPRRGDKK